MKFAQLARVTRTKPAIALLLICLYFGFDAMAQNGASSSESKLWYLIVGTSVAVSALISVIGFGLLSRIEVSTLKNKGWMNESSVKKYSFVTNLINSLICIPVAVLPYIPMWLWLFSLESPQFIETQFTGIAALPFLAVLCLYAIFVGVRLLTARFLDGGSLLTWKYVLGQSALTMVTGGVVLIASSVAIGLALLLLSAVLGTPLT